jgi:FkbM family methyltransferase
MSKWLSSIAHHGSRRGHTAGVRCDYLHRRWRGWRQRWLFEVGVVDAAVTAAYLQAGYQVLCIEVDPLYAERLAQQFAGSACTVLNVAIGSAERTIPFMVPCPGTADRVRAHRRAQEISVRVRTLPSVLAEFGVPYLLRVNVARVAHDAIVSLTPASALHFVTFVASHGMLECLLHLHAIGFRHFNMSQHSQSSQGVAETIELQPTQQAHQRSLREWHPSQRLLSTLTASGCVGETAVSWRDDRLGPLVCQASSPQLGGGWRDIHQMLRDVSSLAQCDCFGQHRIALLAAKERSI